MRLLPIAVLICLGLLTAACDTFIVFTVAKDTDETLEFWLMLEDCDDVVGNKNEYEYVTSIGPHATINISDVTGLNANASYCVQAVDENRRLVLTERYEYDATYTIRQPLERGETIPDTSALPKSSLRESFWESPPIFIGIALLIFVGLLGGASYAFYRGLRSRKDRPNPL